jgi:hypothetical protein
MELITAAGIEPGLQTEHVFDYYSLLKPPVAIGRAQYGTRVFYEALGGRLEGPQLSGEVLAGGGDWALMGDDGWTRIDVRGQCRTDDGALLYFAYRGLVEPSQAVISALAGGPETGFEDHYWRVMIEIETGDERYRWLTQSALVGRGRVCRGPGAAYQVYRVL